MTFDLEKAQSRLNAALKSLRGVYGLDRDRRDLAERLAALQGAVEAATIALNNAPRTLSADQMLQVRDLRFLTELANAELRQRQTPPR